MLNPATYINADPFVRKQYLRSLFGIAGMGATVTGLGKAFGAEVEENPNSSDFGKMKFGNVRLDPYAGFQQYIVAAHRLISGESKSTTTGREYSLTSGRYGSPTRLDVAARFAESKLNPTMSFITTILKGKNFAGLPVNVKDELVSRFVPIIAQDIMELAEEDPKLIPYAIPAFFGMGLQNYPSRTSGTQLMQGDVR